MQHYLYTFFSGLKITALCIATAYSLFWLPHLLCTYIYGRSAAAEATLLRKLDAFVINTVHTVGEVLGYPFHQITEWIPILAMIAIGTSVALIMCLALWFAHFAKELSRATKAFTPNASK